MDHATLRCSNRTDLAQYLRQAAVRSSTKAVTDELLSAVLVGSIPPKIFHVWLSASHDADVLQDAINQDHSRTIRSAGLRHFGRLFCGPRLQEAWRAIGGTPGILNILSRVSVHDVHKFCTELGKGGTVKVESALRQRCTDELFEALCYQHFPETELRTIDPRPLFTCYQELLPACSSELLVRHVENEVKSLATTNTLRLLQAHSSVFREKYLSILTGQSKEWTSMKISTQIFQGLSTDAPAGQDPRISTSMLFAIRLLQRATQETVAVETLSHYTFQRELVTPLFRKLVRRKCRPEVLQEIVRMLVIYREKYTPDGYQRLSRMENGGPIWCIISRWVRHPDQLEGSLVDFLGSLSKRKDSYEQQLPRQLSAVPLSMRWRLLQLLMKHHPGIQVDLTSDADLQAFKERWPVSLFLTIPASHARSLLERLIRLKPEGHFMNWTGPRLLGKSKSWISQHSISLSHNDEPISRPAGGITGRLLRLAKQAQRLLRTTASQTTFSSPSFDEMALVAVTYEASSGNPGRFNFRRGSASIQRAMASLIISHDTSKPRSQSTRKTDQTQT
nr:hypothetical protein CFP56_60273 [Quercus suber]